MKALLSITRRAFVVGAAIIGAASVTSANAQDTLRFGLAMPLSGSQALYGQDQVKAAQWGVAEINAKGGMNGKKLEMIILDTRADAQAGIEAVNRLVSVEKVPVFITAWSSVVKAVAPVANDNKVTELSVGANSADIAKLGDYVYTTYPLADIDITAVANYAATKMGKKKAAVLYINNESGTVGAQIFRDAFTKTGGTVVAYEAYDPKASDWTGSLLKVRAANPDIVHIQGLGLGHPAGDRADAPARLAAASDILLGRIQSEADPAARQGRKRRYRHLACARCLRQSGSGGVCRTLEERSPAASRMVFLTRNTYMMRRSSSLPCSRRWKPIKYQ